MFSKYVNVNKKTPSLSLSFPTPYFCLPLFSRCAKNGLSEAVRQGQALFQLPVITEHCSLHIFPTSQVKQMGQKNFLKKWEMRGTLPAFQGCLSGQNSLRGENSCKLFYCYFSPPPPPPVGSAVLLYLQHSPPIDKVMILFFFSKFTVLQISS